MAAKSITPLECILQNMRRHIRARRWAEAEKSAALAAPYMHPRLAATAVTVKPSLKELIANASDEELREMIEECEVESTPEEREAFASFRTRGNA